MRSTRRPACHLGCGLRFLQITVVVVQIIVLVVQCRDIGSCVKWSPTTGQKRQKILNHWPKEWSRGSSYSDLTGEICYLGKWSHREVRLKNETFNLFVLPRRFPQENKLFHFAQLLQLDLKKKKKKKVNLFAEKIFEFILKSPFLNRELQIYKWFMP